MKIISSLDAFKAYGFDHLSVRMIKLCDLAIAKPVSIIFKNCLTVHTMTPGKIKYLSYSKKNDKQITDN